MTGGALRVLLADDDAEDRLLLQDLLCRLPPPGCVPECVDSFDAAVAAFAQARHDVYLVAQQLGPHRGDALLGLPRHAQQRAPILVLMDSDDALRERELLAQGAADCLVKGQIDVAGLARSLRGALGRQQVVAGLLEERDRLRSLFRGQVQKLREALREQQRLARSEASLRGLLHDSDDAVLVWPLPELPDPPLLYANPAAATLFGLAARPGQPLPAAAAAALAAPVPAPVTVLDGQGRPRRLLPHSACTDWDGQEATLLVLRELAPAPPGHGEALPAAGAVSGTDPLTGLPDRNRLMAGLARALADSGSEGRRLVALVIDLDHFKEVNDTLGHEIGDRLLREVAARIGRCLGGGDTLGRLGDDEFLVLLPGLSQADAALPLVREIAAAVAAPCELGGRTLYASCSIGVAVSQGLPGEPAQPLVQQADMAMYAAKRAGRNTWQVYSAELMQRLNERTEMRQRLQTAIRRREFELHYQPVLDLASGRIGGVEALIRWQHPGLGQISPARFVPLAEETGQIVALGEWVLEEACARHRQWLEQGLVEGALAVNVSALQLQRPDFPALLQGVLERTGLSPQRLQLDLTEAVLMEPAGRAADTLRGLRELGIGIAIDDFGTGFSSLGQLRRLPVDKVKIDRSFVADMADESGGGAIALSVMDIARHLGLQVSAEGVETPAQLQALRRHGCHQAQGYLIALPMPAARLDGFLREFRLAPAGEAGPLQAPRVLLVHGEPEILRSMARALRREECRVRTAGSAVEALGLLREESAELLLADLHLPDGGGLALLQAVHALYPALRRSVLCGRVDLPGVQAAAARGEVDAWLPVPWRDEALQGFVRQSLHRRELDDAAAAAPPGVPAPR